MRTVATAGHVDHGKSSLVLALTGTDPDRFPEEKARGLTIDLGFAFTTLPSGLELGFVDVPGHVRFARNMLAGVGAVDVAVLVVAADEGWMPQTEEHLRVLELLGIEHGIVVLTKTGLVDDETLELARLELDDHLTGTRPAGWPVLAVDSPSGRGIAEVRDALDAVLAAAPPPTDAGRARLWVDRAFSVAGAGTVVTGTLTGGGLRVDDEVWVEPGHRRARVRGIESHHRRLGAVEPGARVALNLAGLERRDVGRGDAVVRPGQWAEVQALDVALDVLAGTRLARRGSLDVHVGSGEHAASYRLLDDDAAFARVRLARPLPLAPGDRMVLRSPARRAVVAGAEVLDVSPARRTADALARLARPLPARVLAARPWLHPEDLVPLAGVERAAAEALAAEMVADGSAVAAGGWVVERDALACVRTEATRRIAARHARDARGPGIEVASLASALGLDTERTRAALAGAPDLVLEREFVRHRDHAPDVLGDQEARRVLDALEAAPFAPPSPADLATDPGTVRALVRAGHAVDLGGVVFAAAAVDEARRRVAAAALDQGSVTVADLRDLLGSTRRYVLALVERFDKEGITRRRGDDRVPGPRAADAVR